MPLWSRYARKTYRNRPAVCDLHSKYVNLTAYSVEFDHEPFLIFPEKIYTFTQVRCICFAISRIPPRSRHIHTYDDARCECRHLRAVSARTLRRTNMLHTKILGNENMCFSVVVANKLLQDLAAAVHIAKDGSDNGEFRSKNGLWICIWI